MMWNAQEESLGNSWTILLNQYHQHTVGLKMARVLWQGTNHLILMVSFESLYRLPKVLLLSTDTLSETNVVPENRPLEKEIPIQNHHF